MPFSGTEIARRLYAITHGRVSIVGSINPVGAQQRVEHKQIR
jgi:hypothetical protein